MSIIPIFVYEAFDKRTCNPFYCCRRKVLAWVLLLHSFLAWETFVREKNQASITGISTGTHITKKNFVWLLQLSCHVSTELEFVDLLTQIGTCPILYQRKIRYTVYIYAKNLEIRHIARGEIRKLVNSYGSYVKVDSHPAWLARIANVSADFLVTIPWHFASQFPFRLRKIPLESSLTQLPSMSVGGKPLTDFSRIMP